MFITHKEQQKTPDAYKINDASDNERRCKRCSTPLTNKRPDAKFCSQRCRVKQWDIDHPDRYKKALKAKEAVGSVGASSEESVTL